MRSLRSPRSSAAPCWASREGLRRAAPRPPGRWGTPGGDVTSPRGPWPEVSGFPLPEAEVKRSLVLVGTVGVAVAALLLLCFSFLEAGVGDFVVSRRPVPAQLFAPWSLSGGRGMGGIRGMGPVELT